MRIALCVLFFGGCAHVATVVPIRNAETWEEWCIQRELECLNTSSAGTLAFPILAPIVVIARTLTGEEIVRNCQLQGELCRIQTKGKGALPGRTNMTIEIYPASQPTKK